MVMSPGFALYDIYYTFNRQRHHRLSMKFNFWYDRKSMYFVVPPRDRGEVLSQKYISPLVVAITIHNFYFLFLVISSSFSTEKACSKLSWSRKFIDNWNLFLWLFNSFLNDDRDGEWTETKTITVVGWIATCFLQNNIIIGNNVACFAFSIHLAHEAREEKKRLEDHFEFPSCQ